MKFTKKEREIVLEACRYYFSQTNYRYIDDLNELAGMKDSDVRYKILKNAINKLENKK